MATNYTGVFGTKYFEATVLHFVIQYFRTFFLLPENASGISSCNLKMMGLT